MAIATQAHTSRRGFAPAREQTDALRSEPAARRFRSSFNGRLIGPGDREHDEARKIRAGNFDKLPALIARPADVIDVIRAVNFARENQLAVAIRSGGHSFAGYSTVDGGLVVDLSGMVE